MANLISSLPFRFFEPNEEYFISERKLPHWTQAGTICFITWRTWDSMPPEVIEAWITERDLWLSRHNIDPNTEGWREHLIDLPASEQRDFHHRLSARWEASLDGCHGACVLRRPEPARVVADSLKYFDSDRYVLTDFVVMPNHVHVLAAFEDPARMLKQCASWKHYTAVKINKLLNRQGRFWEVEGFDHLVRSPEQFECLRTYIAENPRQAHLQAGEFVHYSREKLV
jgi:putative transposase